MKETMCGHTNLTRREGGTYYARASTPKALQEARRAAGISSRPDVWKSLRTKDKAEAKTRLRAVLDAWEKEWARELAALTTPLATPTELRTPTAEELLHAVRTTVESMRDQDEAARMAGERATGQSQKVSTLLIQLRRSLGMGAEPLPNVERSLERIAAKHRFHLPPGSPERKAAMKLYERGLADLLQVLERRNEGDFSSGFADPLFKAPASAGALPARAPAGPRVLDLLEDFLRERMKGLSPEQEKQKRAAVRDFVEMFGKSRPVAQIDRVAMRDFKNLLRDFPAHARRRKEFVGLSFPEIVEKNRVLGLPTIKDKTVNSTLAHLGAFGTWLQANAYLEDGDLTSGLLLAVDKREGARESYTDSEIVQIFGLPLFRGTRSAASLSHPGRFQIRDSRFWLPLLCLFTGARLGEMVQLEVGDVLGDGGIPTLQLRTEGETRKVLKTKFSQRPVPIHSQLINLGFLDHVGAARAARATRVFPELLLSAKGGRDSHAAGKTFRRYLERNGMTGSGFHRLRHTVIDALRRAGYLDEQITAIVGHQSSGTTTTRYGSLASVTIEQRRDMIESIQYPGLELSSLYRASPGEGTGKS